MLQKSITKIVVQTPCNKVIRMNQQRLKKDSFGTYIECPWANTNCNFTCNVKLIEG